MINFLCLIFGDFLLFDCGVFWSKYLGRKIRREKIDMYLLVGLL